MNHKHYDMGANTMVAIFRRRATSIAACLFLLAVGYAGNAAAQVPPMKEIVIYNNTHKDTIYPVLAAFTGRVDLWMQAQFKNDVTNVATQLFCNNDPYNTPCNAQSGVPPLYRAYINPNKGIHHGEFVSIMVPFYTQLMATTPATIGTSSGQYIDWWNAGRIFFYDGETAVSGAYNYNVDQTGTTVPPTPVNPIGGAKVPSCAPDNMFNCEPVTLVSYIGIFPTGSIPFDFGEYTFASAVGPPPGGLELPGSPLKIDLKRVNFNVSAVDGVYLPVAMAALGNSTPEQRGPPLPDTPTMLREVYGWAEFPGCVGPLAATPGYDTAIGDFCELQYNYLTDVPPNDIFNPYARLIHDTLKSNAYSFSIDDKAAFLGVPGDGLIITIGGPKGLVYPNEQYPLPELNTIRKFCH